MIEFSINNRYLISKIIGDIDHHTAEEIRTQIEKEYKNGNCKDIILDFSEVTFMDSSGIGMIIGRYKNIEKEGGTLLVSNITEDIKRIFILSGLHKIINIYDSIDTALDSQL